MKHNNFLSKIFAAFVFVAAFAIFGIIGLPGKAKAAALPVQLYYSQHVTDSRWGSNHLEGYIAVQNLAFQKNVTVHYTIDNGKTWADVPATYVKQNLSTANEEIWKFATPTVQYGQQTMFCIKYQVNGQTYWDNNNGNNYTNDAFGKSIVYVNSHDSYTYNGQKYIYITASTKDSTGSVKVRYTEDGWKTYKDLDCRYISNYSSDPIPEWDSEIPVSSSTKQVQFVVINQVNGVQYFDNNFGYNYSINF